MKRLQIINNDHGGILVMTCLISSLLIILGVSLAQLLSLQHKKLLKNTGMLKASYLAEAGIHRAIGEYLLNDSDKNWRNNQFQTIYENVQLGQGNYSVSSQNADVDAINIVAIGYCRGIEKRVAVRLTVNWQTEPPAIQLCQWNERGF